MEGETRAGWLRRSSEMAEVLAIRTELKAREEAGVTKITVEEARRIFGPRADALIAGAIRRAEAREAEQIRDQAAVSNQRDVGSSRIEPASVDQVPRDCERVRAAESIAQRERAETRAAATPVIEPDHEPLDHLTTEAAQAERPEELTYEELHSTDILIGRVDDDEVQAEKTASQRM